MAVIRSVTLPKETILLPSRRNGHHLAPPSIAATRPTVRAAEPPAEIAPAPVPQISYAEYRHRFTAELEKERRDALEQAALQGLEEGRAQGLAELSTQAGALAGVVRAAQARLDAGLAELGEVGAEIAYEAVCKVLGRAFTERDGVIAATREAVRGARERSRLVVRVSPADYQAVSEQLDRVLEGLKSGEVEVAADERVALGGCLLETPAGNLDCRLEVQLESLRRALLEARAAQPAAGAQ